MAYDVGTGTETKPGDAEKGNKLLRRYRREIERYGRATSEWYEEGDQIEQTFLKETPSSSDVRKFALLWANVDTLKSAVYHKLPVVLCSRRYKDKDPIGRVAAELMERATNTAWDLYRADECFKMVRDDRLIPGRGQAWVRYEARIEKYDDPDGTIDNDSGEVIKRERLKSEKVCTDYVHWRDFGHNVARTWADVWLVWRWVYKTQEEIAERFGGDVAAKLAYNAKAPSGSYDGKASNDDGDNRCKIAELWDKHLGLTSWLADGHDEFLESGPPPVDFFNFFPCPEPCYATKTSKQLVPRPDYVYYRDQAKEINDLTDKIARMTQWLIVKGFVPSGPSSIADPLEEALRDKTNSELFVQVDSWKEFSERGGAEKLINWLPIDMVVKALQSAIMARNQLIQDVFQLTGLSDILRGQTDPNETLGAQQLKAQTGSRRLQNTRDEVARWCRDIALLNAEVIAEQFSPQSIAEITGFKYVPTPPQQPMLMLPRPGMPTPGMGGAAGMGGAGLQGQAGTGGLATGNPMAQQMGTPLIPQMGHNGGPQMGDDADPTASLVFDDRVMQLLRNDKMRSFRIEVQTDQTGQADENAEKQRSTELLNVLGGYLKQAIEIVQVAPALAPVAKEFLLITARTYRAGKGLEETLERAFEAAMKEAQAARQQAQQQGSPELAIAKQELQLEAEKAKAGHALDVEKAKADAQLAAQKQSTDAQIAIRQQNITAALQQRKQQQDSAVKAQQAREKATRTLH